MFNLVRKHYFIKKGLQTRFIGTVLLIVALVMVVIFCNLYFFGMFLTQDSEYGAVYADAFEKLKTDLSTKLMGRLILLGVVNVIIVILISLFFSHQIAGPVYKLEKTLNQIIEGDSNVRFSFRQSDRFDELAELLNDMKDKYTAVIKNAKEVNQKSVKIIDEAVAKKDTAALAELKEANMQLANALNEFNFSSSQAAENKPSEDKVEENKA